MLPQLSAAPQFLPRSLRVADLAANQVTEIFPLTFGEKPALRYPLAHLGPSRPQAGLGHPSRGLREVMSLRWAVSGRQDPGCSV